MAREDQSQGRAVPVPSGRVARLTGFGAMTAGVAGRMALGGLAELGQGRRPSARQLLLTPANLRRVTEQLARMRGAAMKIGQMVSMDSGDMLPPDLAAILARLRDDAHFMPPAQLKTVLNAAWPKGWLGAFAEFGVRPVAAASIGQVHRARLKDGHDLAIKVQYPGVAASIDSDVANVGALLRVSGLLPSGFDLAPYLEEARAQLHEETDYLREARHLTDFNALLVGDERFMLPQLDEEWTRPNVLAMGYVEGVPIEGTAQAPQADRDRIAHDLIDLVLTELFGFGLMQTDPNFANYRYDRESGRIVLLDFGATRQIGDDIAALYAGILRAGLAGDAQGLREAALALGILAEDTRPDHANRIVAMMMAVFKDLLRAPHYDFGASDLARRMQADGMALAEDGFIPPPLPVAALFVQRKLGGTFLLASRLRARVAVRELIETHLERLTATL